jgi:PKD repeat protein
VARSSGRSPAAALQVGAALVVFSLLGVAVAQGQADPPAQLDLRGGGAWVASSTVGQLTLIDGGTAEVAARVQVAETAADVLAVQAGTVGYALDRGQGTVRRIDPATFVAAAPVEVIEGARGDLSAHPHGDVVYVVDHERGRVAVADARSLSGLRGEVQSLAEAVRSSVVDDAGRLWALGTTTGDITWFDGEERHARRGAVADPASAELVVIDGRPALVERAGRVVRALGGDGGFGAESCLEIEPSDRSVRVAGSDGHRRLYVVSGDDGVLRVSDLASGQCGGVVIDIADPGSDLGAPQEAQGRVFIPDYTRGTVVIVDLESREVTRTGELVAAGTEFELFDKDGIVFYNDPGSERAGVVRVDGTFVSVQKYDADRPRNGVVPEDGRDQPAGTGEGGVGGSDPGGGDEQARAPDQPGDDPDPPGEDDPAGPAGEDEQDLPDAAETPDPGVTKPEGGGPSAPPDPGSVPPAPGGPTGNPLPGTQLVIVASALAAEIGESIDMSVRPAAAGETVTDVTWDFGDGGTAAGTRTSHAWDAAGTFRVRVQGTLGSGTTAIGVADFVVRPPTPVALQADFSFGPGTAETFTPVTFTDLSQGGPTSWSWTFERALGSGTSALPSPPPQQWGFAGTYAVTLEVRRGSDRDTTTRTITIADPPPGAPVVMDIVSTEGPPYDDQTDYTFFAHHVSEPVDRCFYTFEGANTDCVLVPSHGTTMLQGTHRFPAGRHTVRLTVEGPGGTTIRALTIDVAALTPPDARITVTGAMDNGGTWSSTEGMPVTFDGSGSTGTFDRLDWRDLVTGATATGPSWTPALAVGRHTIRLTAVSPRLGDASRDVIIDVSPADTSAPTGSVDQTGPVAGSMAFTATADDPESGVASIRMFAHISGRCYRIGDMSDPGVPFDFDYQSEPYATGQGGQLVPAGGTSVTFTASIQVCGAGLEPGPPLGIDVWAVVTNGADQTFTTDHYFLFT